MIIGFDNRSKVHNMYCNKIKRSVFHARTSAITAVSYKQAVFVGCSQISPKNDTILEFTQQINQHAWLLKCKGSSRDGVVLCTLKAKNMDLGLFNGEI